MINVTTRERERNARKAMRYSDASTYAHGWQRVMRYRRAPDRKRACTISEWTDAAWADAAPVSASIFGSSLRSAPYVFTCVCARARTRTCSFGSGGLPSSNVRARETRFGMGHLHGMLLERVADREPSWIFFRKREEGKERPSLGTPARFVICFWSEKNGNLETHNLQRVPSAWILFREHVLSLTRVDKSDFLNF